MSQRISSHSINHIRIVATPRGICFSGRNRPHATSCKMAVQRRTFDFGGEQRGAPARHYLTIKDAGGFPRVPTSGRVTTRPTAAIR